MHLEPTSSGERLPAVDALRGFALFGILAVNTLFFSQPSALGTTLGSAGSPDALTHYLVAWLAQTKFYGLFSFLFGLGFAIQMERWEGQGPRRFRRRLLVLLGFGLAHGLLLWMGDILTAYALFGMLLPFFRKAKPRTLLVWVCCLLGLQALGFAAVGGLTWMGQTFAQADMAKGLDAARSQATQSVATAMKAYGVGPYSALFRFRAQELAANYFFCLMLLPHIFSMYLLGLWVWKRQVFQAPDQAATLLQRALVWGLGLGLPLNALIAWWSRHGMVQDLHLSLFGMALNAFAAPLLTFGYVALVLTLLRQATLGRFVGALRWTGRMALTSYLTHSVVMTTVFYFYGGGLFGRLRLHWSLLIALGIALAQIPLSRWWLSRHPMGPAEWLWRRLTYGRFSSRSSHTPEPASQPGSPD